VRVRTVLVDALDVGFRRICFSRTSVRTVIEEQLETGNELFKVDFAISRESDGVKVPIIFIESENNVESTDHEVRKLVSLAAPLRVLIDVVSPQKTGGWKALDGSTIATS
jgi:hypothetical protein